VTTHNECRDEIFWQYALRDEKPPLNEIIGVKKLDLSFNKLGNQTAMYISRALKTDQYLRQVNLRSN